MKKIELKRCPFCGSKARFGLEDEFCGPVDERNWVECTSCHAEIQIYDTREEAAKAWNTRVGETNV